MVINVNKGPTGVVNMGLVAHCFVNTGLVAHCFNIARIVHKYGPRCSLFQDRNDCDKCLDAQGFQRVIPGSSQLSEYCFCISLLKCL